MVSREWTLRNLKWKNKSLAMSGSEILMNKLKWGVYIKIQKYLGDWKSGDLKIYFNEEILVCISMNFLCELLEVG